MSPSVTASPEALVRPLELTDADQQWLACYGVDPSWLTDEVVVRDLRSIVTIGSLHIDEDNNDGIFQEIVQARETFFRFVAIDQATIEYFQHNSRTLIPLDTFIGAQRVLHASGLDAVKVINTLPAVLSLAPETVQAKVQNLAALGLDAVKVINTQPAAIGLAPETVQAKVAFVKRTVQLLGWQGDTIGLIQEFPALLGFSTKKLQILRRIAATVLSEGAKELEVKKVKSQLIVPLERYIISIDKVSSPDDGLLKRAQASKLGVSERKQRAAARALSGELGRIGAMYLTHAKVQPTNR